jgi:D-alanyl-D-alanine endopeptidase (penicillin-binding protein 7)
MKKLIVLFLSLAAVAAPAKPVKQPPRPNAAIVYNITEERLVYSFNSSEEVSIASMTKLITVLTVLDAGQSLSETIKVKGRESSSRIKPGLELSRYDLIELSMVSSDNLAARTLLEHYPGGYQAGINAMNSFVARIGASNTVLVEPTGLFGANKSTAQDLVKITRATMNYSALFNRFANLKSSEVRAERIGRTQRIAHWIAGRTTNPFAHENNSFEIQAFKTGFTSAAGWCITMLVKYNQQQYIIVTAGNSTKKARRDQADQLIKEITNQQYLIQIADSPQEL